MNVVVEKMEYLGRDDEDKRILQLSLHTDSLKVKTVHVILHYSWNTDSSWKVVKYFEDEMGFNVKNKLEFKRMLGCYQKQNIRNYKVVKNENYVY
jgi:hypothetical protein